MNTKTRLFIWGLIMFGIGFFNFSDTELKDYDLATIIPDMCCFVFLVMGANKIEKSLKSKSAK